MDSRNESGRKSPITRPRYCAYSTVSSTCTQEKCIQLQYLVPNVQRFITVAEVLNSFIQWFLDMHAAPAATRSYLTTVCVLFCFVSFLLLVKCGFFRVFLYHCRFLFCMESCNIAVFFRDDAFLPCDHDMGWILTPIYVRIQSNQ